MVPRLIALALLGLGACAADDDPVVDPHPQELADSRAIWDALGAEDYTYVRYLDDGFGPGLHRTTVVIAGGVAVERSYSGPNGEWTETGEDIGSHDDGFFARTMERMYQECAEDVIPRAGGSIEVVLTMSDDELLWDCYSIDHSIEDAVGYGVRFESFTLGP